MNKIYVALVLLFAIPLMSEGSTSPSDSSGQQEEKKGVTLKKLSSLIFDDEVVNAKIVILNKAGPSLKEAGYSKTASFLGVWSASLELLKGFSKKSE